MASGSTRSSERLSSRRILLNAEFVEKDGFPNGRLPTKKAVIERTLHLMRETRSLAEISVIVADELCDIWEFCNIVTINRKYVRQRVQVLHEKFTYFYKFRARASNPNSVMSGQIEKFNADVLTLFDIFCEDQDRRKKEEQASGVKMCEDDYAFLENMRTTRTAYCDSFTDRKWQKAHDRKRRAEEALEKQRQKSLRDQERLFSSVSVIDEDEVQSSLATPELPVSVPLSTSMASPSVFTPPVSSEKSSSPLHAPSTSSESEPVHLPSVMSASDLPLQDPDYVPDLDILPPRQGQKRKYVKSSSDAGQLPPEITEHVRISERIVDDRVYRVIDKLICRHHLSMDQAKAAVVEIANALFGRRWKYHDEDPDIFDDDTLPHDKHIREAMNSFEALVLKQIALKIMSSDEKTCVTWHDDGSRRQGVGAYAVQGISIDGEFHNLPTLKIATETRENLADMRITVLKMLSAVSGVDVRELHDRVDFVMTDSTSHNIGVEHIVAKKVQSEKIPDSLLCQVHVSLCFNRVLLQAWSDVESRIGRQKAFVCVSKGSHSSLTAQALDVMMRLVSRPRL